MALHHSGLEAQHELVVVQDWAIKMKGVAAQWIIHTKLATAPNVSDFSIDSLKSIVK